MSLTYFYPALASFVVSSPLWCGCVMCSVLCYLFFCFSVACLVHAFSILFWLARRAFGRWLQGSSPDGTGLSPVFPSRGADQRSAFVFLFGCSLFLFSMSWFLYVLELFMLINQFHLVPWTPTASPFFLPVMHHYNLLSRDLPNGGLWGLKSPFSRLLVLLRRQIFFLINLVIFSLCWDVDRRENKYVSDMMLFINLSKWSNHLSGFFFIHSFMHHISP